MLAKSLQIGNRLRKKIFNEATLISRRRFGSLIAGAGILRCTPLIAATSGPHSSLLPDEAHRHERTFMQWPTNVEVYPDTEFLDTLKQSIADVANTIAEFEPVVMLMASSHRKAARKKLSEKGRDLGHSNR